MYMGRGRIIWGGEGAVDWYMHINSNIGTFIEARGPGGDMGITEAEGTLPSGLFSFIFRQRSAIFHCVFLHKLDQYPDLSTPLWDARRGYIHPCTPPPESASARYPCYISQTLFTLDLRIGIIARKPVFRIRIHSDPLKETQIRIRLTPALLSQYTV